MRSWYPIIVVGLSVLSLLFSLGILYGEIADQWSFGGAMIGALLLAYFAIVVVLRKMGIIGPRRAER